MMYRRDTFDTEAEGGWDRWIYLTETGEYGPELVIAQWRNGAAGGGWYPDPPKSRAPTPEERQKLLGAR